METESTKMKTSAQNSSKPKEEKPAAKRKPKAENSSKTHETNLSSSEKRTLGLVIGAVATIIGVILSIYWGLKENFNLVSIGGILLMIGVFIIWYTEAKWNGWSQEWLEESARSAKEAEIKRKREQEEYEIWKMKMGL